MTYSKSQSGNVFIVILLGVFLFGALMYMFSRSANQGTGNLTKQQSKVAAQEILNYARLVEGAVDRVRRNGCSENEISFDNAVVSGYSHSNSPVDKSCHVFESEGGKIEYHMPTESFFDSTYSADSKYQIWIFHSGFQVEGVGTSNTDLIIRTNYIKKEICMAINDLLNITNTGNDAPTDENDTIGNFIGSFGPAVADTINDDGTGLANLSTACRYKPSAGNYKFYHVLLAR